MERLDLSSADSVEHVFRAGARANLGARCRRGSIDLIEAPGILIATGDLHDNPLHMARLVKAANMHADGSWAGIIGASDPGSASPPGDGVGGSGAPRHLMLHEIIHPEQLVGEMDFSHRALARVAWLKCAYPEHVHVLLANHELSQVIGAGIVKNGVRVVEAFSAGVERVFGERAGGVNEAIAEFIWSMPLALRCVTPKGDILCAHSLPTPGAMGRFDPSVLLRDLTPQDYEPLRGSAHLMVWGRGYDAEQIEDLVERWGVNMFILGHAKVEEGARLIPPCAVVLNSDHERGVYLVIDLEDPPSAEEAVWSARPLGG